MELRLFAHDVTLILKDCKYQQNCWFQEETPTSIERIYTVLLINLQLIIKYDASIEPHAVVFSLPFVSIEPTHAIFHWKSFHLLKKRNQYTFCYAVGTLLFQGFYMYNCTLSSLDFLNFRVLSLIDTSAVFIVIFFLVRNLCY